MNRRRWNTKTKTSERSDERSKGNNARTDWTEIGDRLEGEKCKWVTPKRKASDKRERENGKYKRKGTRGRRETKLASRLSLSHHLD